MAARTAIATAGASSAGNASPNRMTAATRATSAVTRTASGRDADREWSAESMAVDAVVGGVALAWLSVSVSVSVVVVVVDVVMVSSFGWSGVFVPGCLHGRAGALSAPSVDRRISGLNWVSSYRRSRFR